MNVTGRKISKLARGHGRACPAFKYSGRALPGRTAGAFSHPARRLESGEELRTGKTTIINQSSYALLRCGQRRDFGGRERALRCDEGFSPPRLYHAPARGVQQGHQRGRRQHLQGAEAAPHHRLGLSFCYALGTRRKIWRCSLLSRGIFRSREENLRNSLPTGGCQWPSGGPGTRWCRKAHPAGLPARSSPR